MVRSIIVLAAMWFLCFASFHALGVPAKAQALIGYPNELDIQDRLRRLERERANLEVRIRLGDSSAIQRLREIERSQQTTAPSGMLPNR